MTVKEKIMNIVFASNHDGYDMDTDDWRKLVAMAYYLGRENATKEVSDKYSELIHNQRKRASECRYKNMVNKIIGDRDYIYFSDYAGNMTSSFGSDETNL